MKGHRTNRAPPPHIPTLIPSPLPLFIQEHHTDVTLCIDFFFVQRIPFLHIIDRKFGYRHTFAVNNRKKATMLQHIPAVIDKYTQRGFVVRDVHADSEFECIRSDIAPINLSVVTTSTHVGEIERSIRTTKENM